MDAILQALTNFSDSVLGFFDKLGTIFTNTFAFIVSLFEDLAFFIGTFDEVIDYANSFYVTFLPVRFSVTLGIGLIFILILRLLGRY